MQTVATKKGQSVSILVIEKDGDSFADIITKDFHGKKEKILIKTSSSLKNAFDLISQFSFDIILSDWQLADGAGIDIIKSKLCSKIPIVLMTEEQDGDDILLKALQMGAYDCIVKSSTNVSLIYPTIIRVIYEYKNKLEHERVEKELLKSNNKYKTLIENLQGIAYRCLFDEHWTMDFLSPSFEAITGYKCEDFINSKKYKFIDIILDEDRQKVKDTIADGAKNNRQFVVEYRIVCADSSIKWVHETGKSYLAKTQVYIDGVILDITERKKADIQVLEWQKKFELISQLSNQAMYVYNKKTKLTKWSKNVAAVLGYDIDELSSFENCSDAAHPDQKKYVVEKFNLAEATNTPYSCEYLFKHKSGKYLHVRELAAATENESTEITGVIQDLSEIKEQEKKLRDSEIRLNQFQKMETLGYLVGGFAHDLNNIINGILGFAQLLQMKLTDQPKLHDYASKITQASMRTAEMSKKLLSFIRKKDSGSEIVDIHAAITDTIDLIETTFGKNIVVKKSLAAQKYHIAADNSQIQNIFINLAVNAKDAMENGGELNFETSNKEIVDPNNKLIKQFIEIIVSDTGKGIPESIINKIFDPFFTTKSEDKGLGLGLFLVAGTVKKLSGSIAVKSNQYGTQFTTLLPICDTDNEKNENACSASQKDKKRNNTILVIDDEKNIRDFIAEYLEDLGYTVYKASNGVEGYTTFSTIKDDLSLIVLDIIMPEMNGKEFYEKIEETKANIPIIFISGHTMDIDIEPLLNKPSNVFLQKPFTTSTISETVSALIK